MSIAPFHIIVIPINVGDEKITKVAFEIYEKLSKNYDVLIDDRDERPGVKFKDADLIGIPIRITVGKAFHENGMIEIKERKSKEKILVKLDEIEQRVKEIYTREMKIYES